MQMLQFETQLIAILTAAGCALPGVFLVLRRHAMVSDAISHTILFGIVVAYLIVGDARSPWLLVGAVLTGLLTVWLIELIGGTQLVKEDSAIGLVFPLLFSLAVLLISRFAADIHLDVDSVLLGELAFAPFDRLTLFGLDLPRALWLASAIVVLNSGLITLFYKELKLSTFDVGLASALGFSPLLLHYGLMSSVSLTAVAAFDAVGAVMVIALMVGPAATAALIAERLSHMLGLSVLFAVVSAWLGYWLAYSINSTIAGSIAAMVGICFTLVLIAAPQRGLIAAALQRRQRRSTFAQQTLLAHLLQHVDSPAAATECRISNLAEHLRWPPQRVTDVVRRAEQAALVQRNGALLGLTDRGRLAAGAAFVGE